jgi:hypothetical protein|tara:strand:+ start:420 stop:1112 length:693 start_codon:yes stop_codon:yes gene_type:complete
MGFINNTSYILNAVLTKKGKQYLAKPGSNFTITKFALADDEVDYTLWDTAHPKGTDYYGAVLESTPMLEPCVDPEVVMKYKLFTMPVGTKALPYITNVTPSSLLGDNALVTGYNSETQPNWSVENHVINPTTQGAEGAFLGENYSFLVLNKNVIDIGVGQGDDVNYNVGAIYNEESGRLVKKVLGKVATITTAISTVGTTRETSIIITGQSSGAIFVLPVLVSYVDNTPS